MANYYDELIIRKGTATRTEAFTPPTSEYGAGGAGFSLVINGLLLTSILGVEFSAEVIDSETGGLHYHINGSVITIDLGGETGVTAADIAELLLDNGLVTVQIISGGTLWGETNGFVISILGLLLTATPGIDGDLR